MRYVDFTRYLLILLILTLSNQTSCGYKILGVFPHGGKSHFFVFAPILRELARKGHEVTVISHFPEKNPLPNYTDISITGAGKIGFNNIPATAFSNGIIDHMLSHIQLSAGGQRNCEALKYPQIQNLIRSNKTFDVILQENFNSDCFMALNYIFKAPSIGLSSCTVMPWLHDRFGIPVNPSYRPMNKLPYGNKMTFYQRVTNTVYYFLHGYLMADILMTKPNDIAVRKYLGANIPSVADIAKNTSLFLINTHYTLNKAWAYPPNVIEISGVHLGKPKALPSDIENFISESPHGVIYFSLGSMILGTSLSDDVKQAFMDAFKELPQRVLWKYEDETLFGKPDNVMIRKWMPQLDILSHPNVVGFISHGGLLGTIEAFYNGVPIVSVPFFGDQFHNAKALESHGTAAILNTWNLKKDSISKALNFILQSRVLEKAKRQARLFRDRPMSPMDTAIWWIEYVARNGGAHETRPAVVNMPFYQSALLDVGLFLVTLLLTIVYINYRLLKLILNKLLNKNKMRNRNFIEYLTILILTLLSQTSCGYKILGVFPHGGKSHFFVFAPILRELAQRGHEVTVISHFPEKNPLPNYKDISIVGAGEIGLNNIPAGAIPNGIFTNIFTHIVLSEEGKQNCEALRYPEIQNLIKSNNTFDVILQENFNTDCFLALNYIFKAPSIGLSSCTVMPWLHDRFGIPLNPSYKPLNFLAHGDKMTFYQRVSNTLHYFLHGYLIPNMYMTKQDDIVVRKYLGENIPSVADIAKNTSLFLINTHYTLNKAWAYPPNVVEISGVHLGKSKALPSDIEKFISESKHGVIYFSFGSMILGSSLSDDVKQAFMDAFKEIPQRILWKYEDETLPGKPDNVMIKKWMPQLDILSHPNVIGFISHSGLLGSIEAFYNGVPMVSIPFFGDQFVNAKALESHGTAAVLDTWNLKKDSISKALNFILQPRVLEKAKRQARLFRDRPMSPLDTAIWWIEYVARNGGADETRPSVVNMPFYQSALLDVGLFLLAVILTIV
ncbi:uncharacterized protein LOC123296047, partial [Chrysoperla carnea]|uniref:uncharacterized protein LOC123296047 n=1 Tax=Chrysoperla carnea TaxID=189513 RepID=UPI001D063B82